MSALQLNEAELLGRYATSKQLQIERLLRQYGNTLEDVRELLPQLRGTITEQRKATQFGTEPVFFTPSEASQMGLGLDEGWLLKISPASGNGGYTSSLITPSKWEITEQDIYISPAGEQYSRADLEALLSPPSGLGDIVPTAGPVTEESLTEEGQQLYQEYQAAGGELGVEDWLNLREKQRLETEQVFGAVFPEEDIQEVVDYINTNPEGFLADIQEIGRTSETERLLRYLIPEITEQDFQDIFGAPTPEYQPESWFKDNILDPLYAGAVSFVHGLKTAFTSILPGVTADVGLATRESIWDTGPIYANIVYALAGVGVEERREAADQIKTASEQKFLQLMEDNRNWIQQHPELNPNPLYLENPFENTELFKDPGYYAYSITNSLAYTATVMGTLVAVSAVATPVVGVPAAMLVAAGPEASSMTEELVKQGVPFEEAAQYGSLYGLAAGGIETVSDLPFIGLLFKPIKTAIQPMWRTIFKGVSSQLAKRILTGVVVTQTEALEEVVTQVVHNAILKHYDETQSLLEGVSHAYIQATIASTPFGAIGGYASHRTFYDNLSSETQQQYDQQVERFEQAGLTTQEAQVQAANELAKTEEVAAELEKAIDAAREEYREEHPEPKIEPSVAEDILQDIEVAEQVKKGVEPIEEVTPIKTGEQYTATVFRGYKPGVGPTDEGLFGKGTYYTTNREYAETYDGKEVMQVTLKNPFVLNSHAEAEAFWNEHTRPVREQALNEGKTVEEADELAAQAARQWLESQGYDGLIARNIIAPGDEVVVFEPEKSVGAREVTPKIPTTEAGMPEAGLQPSMLEEVPAKEVRPQARGKLVQSRLDDYLRLREYNKERVSDRIAEIKSLLEKKGRLPKELGNKGNLRLELARLEALLELEVVDSIESLDKLIREVGEELGLRSIPYPGRAKNIFPGYTTKQLEEMVRVYQEARETMSPEIPADSPVKASDIPIDIPAVTSSQLTPGQIERTLELFKEAVAAPSAESQRAAAIELRKHVFAQRAKTASESAEAMIAEGMNPEEAIIAAEQMFMSGKLPDVETNYFNDLTQEMRNVLFGKVYNYWHDKPGGWTELISTFEALTNALAGKSIPRVRGIGTKYFPEGGSAWDRLARVFIGETEVLEALDRQIPLPDLIEGIYLETGRGELPLNQGTVNWLSSLAKISEEDKLLLSKPLSEISEFDVRRIARQWFYERRNELNMLLGSGVINNQEYKLELAIAKDRVFPHKPMAPQVTYPAGGFGQVRLGEGYVPLEAPGETRAETELRLKREAMEAEKGLAEARAKKGEFQPVIIDPELNDLLSKQLPLLTLREKQLIIRNLKNAGLTVVDIGNLIRGNKASFDFSYWRQAMLLACGHPVLFYRSNIEAWQALWNQESAEASWLRITKHPYYQLYLDAVAKGGTDFLRPLTLPKGTEQYKGLEEFGFPGGERPIPRFAERIPWMKISARAFVTGCNDISWNVFVNLIEGSKRYSAKIASGEIILPEGEGFNLMDDVVGYTRELGDFVQRASLGKAAPLAPHLGGLFFAIRSKLGRLLAPRHLISSNPRVRAEAWRDFMSFIGITGGIVMMGYFLGLWDVERDSRNAEFMSIRIGNLRIDPWTGYRQFLTLYARIITGTGISSVTGREYESNPWDAIWGERGFMRSSLSPLAGLLADFVTGKTFLGEEVDVANLKQWIDRIAPFSIQDIYEAWMDKWQHGLIAILPAIFGEGVQTYTGDWVENWQKLGLPKYPENTGYGIDEPVYDLADFWADTAGSFRGVDPSTLTESKGYPDYVRSIAQTLQVIEQIELLPNKRLASINADPEEGVTFKQYYEMWQERQRIVASGDEESLEAFDADERTRNAYLGNMTQSQYALLVEYHSLAEDQKAEFLAKHPELYGNPREDWLRGHPEENALLALWDKSKIYSLDALTKMHSLASSLGIPENTIAFDELSQVTELKLKHEQLFDLLDIYSGLDDTVKGDDGLTAHDRAIQELYLEHPDFRDDQRRIEALGVGTEDNPTPENIVESWVERGIIVDEYGAGSAEAKLWLIDNSEAHQWALDNALLSDDGSDWNEPILRLQVEYGEDFDLYDAYGDTQSDDYIADDDQRAEARRGMLFEENNLTEFGKAYYTKQASSEGYSEANWPAFVEYSQLPTWGSWRERFLLDNLSFYKEYTDKNIGNHPLIDTSTIKPLARDKIYLQFQNEFAEWDDTGGMNSKEIENMRERLDDVEHGGLTFREARYSVQAYDEGFPENLITDYVEWYSVDRSGYEDDWWLMDHMDFYNKMLELGKWTQERDFSTVPTREVYALYQQYQNLPSGGPRLDFRAKYPELDAWLVRTKGYTPVEGRGTASETMTPYEEHAYAVQFSEQLQEMFK